MRRMTPTLLLLLLPVAAAAVLHVDLGAPESHQWTVTYRFAADQAGDQSMDILPYEAMIEIVDLAPEKESVPLRWEPINEGERGKPKIRVHFPEPIKPGGRFVFRLVAKLTDPNAYFEDTAKLNFLYKTGHELHVSLPLGFYPIYTGEAMNLQQEDRRVGLSSKGGEVRPVVLFAVRCAPAGPPPASVAPAESDSE